MTVEETLKRLSYDRKSTLQELERINKQMKYAAHSAIEQGMHAPTIAKHLGVAKRTVYLWTK